MQKRNKKPNAKDSVKPNNPDIRPKFHPGSTVQGGSDFGQGSLALGSDAYKQGEAKNRGSNYGNEKWEEDDLNTGEDTPPPPPRKRK